MIGVIENQAPTRHLRLNIPVINGEIKPDLTRDMAKIALVERHQATGSVQVGLVQGFGFNASCAIASTVAHDSHHMIVVGTDEENMALAANQLAQLGGGQIVVKNRQVIGKVELADCRFDVQRARRTGGQTSRHDPGRFSPCGCQLNNPNMQLSLLALVVIPELRISDLGLVDVTRFDFIPVFENGA